MTRTLLIQNILDRSLSKDRAATEKFVDEIAAQGIVTLEAEPPPQTDGQRIAEGMFAPLGASTIVVSDGSDKGLAPYRVRINEGDNSAIVKILVQYVAAAIDSALAARQPKPPENADKQNSIRLDPKTVLDVCKERDWSLHWSARGAYLHLESSELIEAISGKKGNPTEEAGDVLIVLMSITEHAGISWEDVESSAVKKVAALKTKERYAGEEFTEPSAPAKPSESVDKLIEQCVTTQPLAPDTIQIRYPDGRVVVAFAGRSDAIRPMQEFLDWFASQVLSSEPSREAVDWDRLEKELTEHFQGSDTETHWAIDIHKFFDVKRSCSKAKAETGQA